MKRPQRNLLLTLLTAAALAGCAHQGRGPQASSDGATLAAPNRPAEVSRQPVAKGLYELAYSARQNALYVASSGGFGRDADPAKVLRLNAQTLAVEQVIPLERKAFGVTLDDAGGRLYVGNTVDLSVTVVDTNAGRVIGVVQLEEKVKGPDGRERYPRDLRELAVDPAATRLFLQGHSDQGSVLYVVDTERLRVERIIPGLGNAKAPGLAFDVAGQRLFITNLLGELITVSTRTLEITQKVRTEAEQPLNIAFDPRSNRLFITDQGLESVRTYQVKSIPGFQSRHPGNRVLVLDAQTGRQLHSIPTAAGPMGILLDSARQRLYVTEREAGVVGVYDSNSYAPLQTVSLPTHPNSLALDPRGNVVYVSIKNGKVDPKSSPEGVARLAF